MNTYILLDNVIKGPLSLATVREMLSAGAIQSTTLIALEGSDVWRTVDSFFAEYSEDSAAEKKDSKSTGWIGALVVIGGLVLIDYCFRNWTVFSHSTKYNYIKIGGLSLIAFFRLFFGSNKG